MSQLTGGGTTTTFAYDADDWRIKKITAPSTQNESTTYFTRGPNGQLLAEWTNTGTNAT